MYETVTNNTGSGWGPLWGAVIGGIGGYLVGKNNAFGNGFGSCGNAMQGGGCQTCFQQGEYTGENRAGLNFIAQQPNANAQLIREGFAAINQQKITDQANEIQALRTQAIVSPTASDLVFLVTCCGSSAPLYSGVTGAQLTATSLTAGVTYVITYDKFTRKFFVTGV